MLFDVVLKEYCAGDVCSTPFLKTLIKAFCDCEGDQLVTLYIVFVAGFGKAGTVNV